MSLFDPPPPPEPEQPAAPKWSPPPHKRTYNVSPIQRVIDSYNGVPCDWIRPDTAPNRPGEPCGQIHDRCRGHVKASADDRAEQRGDPCGSAAIAGGLVCRHHGGSIGQVKAAARQRKGREDAQARVGAIIEEAMGHLAGMSGAEQMLMAIEHAGAMALGYRWLLDELPERSQWSFSENIDEKGKVQRFVNLETDGLLGPDDKGTMRLHAYEEGFHRWTSLHAKLLKDAAAIGLEERRQTLAEQQVRTVGAAIRQLVEGLGHELDDPKVVPVVEASLRLIAGDTAA